MAPNEIIVDVKLSTKKAEGTLDNFEKKSANTGEKAGKKIGKNFKSGFDNSLQGFGKNIAKQFIGIAVAVQAVRSLGSAFKGTAVDAKNFERAIKEINTILPGGAKVSEDLAQDIQELSKQFGTSNVAQAKAFYQVISAGITDTTKASRALVAANKLTLGGLADIGSSINVLTDILNVYESQNLSATEAADSLFQAVKLGKTTVPELSSALGQALAPARNLNISLDELNASLAVLTTRGNTTSENVTQLSSLFNAIAKNSKQLGSGFDVAAVKTEGFVTVLKRLAKRTKGSQTALFELLGRKEAVNAFLKLSIDGFSKLEKTISGFGDKAGASSKAAQELRDSLDFDLDQTSSEFGALSTNIGTVLLPAFRLATRAAKNFAKVLNVIFQKDSTKAIDVVNKKLTETGTSINSALDKLKEAKAFPQKTLFGGLSTSGKAVIRLGKQIDELRIKRKELLEDRAGILAESKKQNKDRVNSNKNAVNSIILQEQNLLTKLNAIGVKTTESVIITESLRLEQLNQLKEQGLIGELQFQQAKTQIVTQGEQQRLLVEEQSLAKSKLNFESLSKAFAVSAKKQKQTVVALGKTLNNVLASGLGKTFQKVGQALANGENALKAFASGVKNIVADIASAFGDFYIKNGIATSVTPMLGGPAVGGPMIAAGAGLKILSGFLGGGGASSGGASGGGGASGVGDIDTSNAGVLDEQDIEQAERQTSLVVNVEGSLIQQQELGQFIAETLSESGAKEGIVITDTVFA